MYSRRDSYLRDRAQRRARRNYDYKPSRMDYRYYGPESRGGYDSTVGRYRYEMDPIYDERPRQSYRVYDYDMRNDYRRDYREDYAINGIGRPREYNTRDYNDDDYKEEYKHDLKAWMDKLKKFDRFGMSKDQIIQKAKEMGVEFKDYSEDEFYTIYLMQVSDYPKISTEPYTYLAMAKNWLEDKDIPLEPSEKVARYMYEIVMADED